MGEIDQVLRRLGHEALNLLRSCCLVEPVSALFSLRHPRWYSCIHPVVGAFVCQPGCLRALELKYESGTNTFFALPFHCRPASIERIR